MDGYIGQIIMFAGNFPPRNWAFCNGQLLPIAENQSLFSIIGTIYGGDGRTTFGLPDLRGRVPKHAGGENGPGLYRVREGQMGGRETHTLSVAEMPSHSHQPHINVEGKVADENSPINNMLALTSDSNVKIYTKSTTGAPDLALNDLSVTENKVGGGQAFSLQAPYLGVNFIIALEGIFPSRD